MHSASASPHEISAGPAPAREPLRVGVAGLGAIGLTIARKLSEGVVPGVRLAAVAVRDSTKATRVLTGRLAEVPIADFAALAASCDVVVECAPAAVLADIARPVLDAGHKLIVLSVGALLAHADLIDLARRRGGQIIVPTGALLGLDAVAAAAEGPIDSVRMVTRKPVAGLLGAPYLVQNGIEIKGISKPLRVFEGTAREAAAGFPANLNVAVALSLAGIGPDRTRLEIWADPTVVRNTHRIIVEADAARIDMTIENVPSENPKTGRITPLSVLATLRKMNAPMRVGT
jgi:aspartate dehydrogenase